MSSLIEQFKRRKCVVTGVRCRISADGALREWQMYCTPIDAAECTPSLRVIMEVCRVDTAFVFELAKRGLFHPQIIEFSVEENDEMDPFNKRIRNFSVVPSKAVELELFFRVHLPLLEPFFLHWLVFDHWLPLLSILCFVCPRLSSLTFSLAFVAPALRWTPFSICAASVFADTIAYTAELMEQILMAAHICDGRRLQWLWVKLNVVDLCEAEFVKLGILRHSHSLFMSQNGPIERSCWNDQTHVIYDRSGREHWLTIAIDNPSKNSAEWTQNDGMDADEENDGRREDEEEDDGQQTEDDDYWDDREGYTDDDYDESVGEESECYSSSDSFLA